MRARNVTPKPGFQFNDSGTDIVRSTVVPFRGADSLTNALSGLGTTNDPRRLNHYCPTVMTQESVAAAYRGSGLMRKIINIPAADMVREWREWSGEDELIEKLVEEEKRLLIRQKVKQAEILRGLGGGAFILGLPGDLSQPVPTTIGTGTLSYVHVVSRWQLSYQRLIDDMNDPRHGEPEMWTANTATGQQMIHPDRIITFRADPIPAILPTGEDQYWGESRVAQVLDAVEDCDTARQAFAALITKARLIRIGIPNLSSIVSTSEGEAAFRARMAAFSTAESIFNATVYDSGNGEGGEEIGDTTYKFEGMKDVMDAYGEWVSAIADIPATRLLGRAPEGLNSSGDSQQADWNKMVKAKQEFDLAPCLDQLDRYLAPSGSDMSYEFVPLDMPTEKERAERFKTHAESIKIVSDTGLVPDRALAEGAQSLLTQEAYMPALGNALAEMGDDERYGISAENDGTDPSALQATEREVIESGTGGRLPQEPAARTAANDAAPRTLYVHRPVKNVADLKRWAKAQGLPELQDNLHVTIAFSRTPLDWMKVESDDWNQDEDGTLTIKPGGVRIVEPLGDRTVVLLFTSSRLSWRHEQIVRAGASHDYDDYQPHISLTGGPVDLDTVDPYQGKIVLGPEVFAEIKG